MTTLDQIRARSEGLTDLCQEYMRQIIRHVQRNCDIECNEHEDSDWGTCKQPDRYDGDRMAAVLADVPRLLAALNAVERQCRWLDTLADGDKHYAKLFRTAVNEALGEAA
jgi:hypothetical protein